MRIKFLSIKLFLLLSIFACQNHEKDKSINVSSDVLAFEQVAYNYAARSQPINLTKVEPTAHWRSYSTSSGIRFSLPDDWTFAQLEDRIEITSSLCNLTIKEKLINISGNEVNNSNFESLQSFDLSSFSAIDKILSAATLDKNDFLLLDEKSKKNLISLLTKKAFFYNQYNKIFFLREKFYLFKSSNNNEIYSLVFLGSKADIVIHIGGEWGGDQNDLVSFLASFAE